MVEDEETRSWMIRSIRLYGKEHVDLETITTDWLRKILSALSNHEILTHQVHVADSAESGHTRERKRRVNHADDLGY